MASGYVPPHVRGQSRSRGRDDRRRNGPQRPVLADDEYNPRGYTSPALRDRGRPVPAPAVNRGRAPPQAHRSQIYDRPASQDYRAWREVNVRIRGLPRDFQDTWKLYQLLSQYGQMCYIGIEGNGAARVVFSTTPTVQFWNPNIRTDLPSIRNRPLDFEVRAGQTEAQTVPSPIDESINFPRVMRIPAEYLTFGFMCNDTELLGMNTIEPSPRHPILVELDLSNGKAKIDLRFSLHLDGSFHRHEDKTPYRLQASLQLVHGVIKYKDGARTCLILSVHEPPKYFRQTSDVGRTHTSRNSSWKEWPKMWERQTDINHDMDALDSEPLGLIRPDPIVDTGRWLTYRLDFRSDQPTMAKVDRFCMALNHHNIPVRDGHGPKLLERINSDAWKYLDPHKASHPSDLHQMQDNLIHLDFDVRYQLEVCISQHRLNEYNMQLPFLQRLSAMDKSMALDLLENVVDSKQTFHDPIKIFDVSSLQASRRRRAPHGCVLMHAVTVTPTTLKITTPTVEVSNRVIRDHSHMEDRFLRVKFEDEEYVGRLFAASFRDNKEAVYRRIRRALMQGIDIAGRRYDLLAHGNSQFREHGAYFFAGTSEKNADQIRASLGQFEKINIVAKYAARVGQCFSTTRSIRQLPRNLKRLNIPDVTVIDKDKKYCFTDGVGKVSPFVAQMIANEFRVNGDDYPSVYQFRMGGHKGVLAVDPTLKGTTVALRPSQLKFDTATQGLEIIRVSSFITSYLNQQIILVLSGRGVPDDVFVQKMEFELERIDKAMTDGPTAMDLLTKNVDFNHVTVSMAEMILNGFMDSGEPFLMSLLQLWRAWRIKFLKEKGHIPIDQGAFVLGCTDETKNLRMEGEESVPEIFIQVKDRETGKWKVMETLCILARNPSLHPGDIRVVRAVACEDLLHLRDVVVLPQRGTRDLANMCSGGDLDGDDYLVMWDLSLQPPETDYPPMDFTPPVPRMSVDVVTKDQLVNNFINYVKHDRLGAIATRHRAWADYLSASGGVKSDKCLRLAKLHSIAVDFPKSGVPAVLDEDLNNLPKWPHWMEMNHKPADKIYRSTAILGQLYDRVVRQEFHPQYSYNHSFDSRILNAYDLSPEILESARELKRGYDADIRRIMAQQGVKTEFEIWTAFVISHNREKRDYQFAEEMGRLTGILKLHHHDLVLEKAGVENKSAHSHLTSEEFDRLAPFVTAMYTVTKEQVEEAKHLKQVSGLPDSETEVTMMPLISFPWIFANELGRIARKDEPRPQVLIAPNPRAPRQRQYVGGTAFAAQLSGIELPPLPEAQAVSDVVRSSATVVGSSAAVSETSDLGLLVTEHLRSLAAQTSDHRPSGHRQYNNLVDSECLTTPPMDSACFVSTEVSSVKSLERTDNDGDGGDNKDEDDDEDCDEDDNDDDDDDGEGTTVFEEGGARERENGETLTGFGDDTNDQEVTDEAAAKSTNEARRTSRSEQPQSALDSLEEMLGFDTLALA